MKLVSMTDFVLEQWNLAGTKELQKYYNIAKYAYFLKQPLELWMFVPCDDDGNVLKEIYGDELFEMLLLSNLTEEQINESYQQAKKRCLFEVECIDISNGVFKGLQFKAKSFKMVEYNITTKKFFYGCNVVEDLIDYELQLTQTAIKQVGV